MQFHNMKVQGYATNLNPHCINGKEYTDWNIVMQSNHRSITFGYKPNDDMYLKLLLRVLDWKREGEVVILSSGEKNFQS